MGYSVRVRAILLLLTLGTALFGQSSFREFLALTPAQVTQVRQLNDTLDQYVSAKQQRRAQVQQELNAEYGKAAPDARALGERYVELDSIAREIGDARAAVDGKVAALLTDTQKGLLRRISLAIVQQGLYRDAVCGYLTDSFPSAVAVPNFAVLVFGGAFVYSSAPGFADTLSGPHQ